MPVITLDKDRFSSFVDRSISVEEMAKWLPWLGIDIEEIGSNYVKIEFNPNRVDFSSYGGVARAFRGLKGWETGLAKYNVRKGKIVLKVDPTVSEIRPYVVAAIIHNIRLDGDSVKELIEMQEDLHWGVGRDRRKASIGVHNLDAVEPPFVYTTRCPNEIKFVPLDKTEEMDLQEVLERHEKGIAYKNHVNWASRYPLIIDKKERVLSFPPIINSELTRVTSQTRNLFIDVTGTEPNAISRSLNVLVTALADMGGTIESVRVDCNDHVLVSPDLTPQRMELRVDYANELLGLRLSEAKAMHSLRKSRMEAKRIGKGVLEVFVPAYRIDIMHEIDLVEEVAIGYGYFRLKPTRPATVTTGGENRASEVANYVRQIMVGLGFVEAMNFVLSKEINHYQKMRRKAGKIIKLANPSSLEYSIVRNELLPSLMKNLADNKHQAYPQRMFEVSDVVEVNEKAETRTERRLHVAGVSSHPTANFTEMKSCVETLLANMGLKKNTIKAAKHPSFLQGRIAAIQTKGGRIGLIGEIHPEVLNNFELENPTSAFEIDLQKILKEARKKQTKPSN
jgi:phenylalanyl-tRNA synthetase beta chain